MWITIFAVIVVCLTSSQQTLATIPDGDWLAQVEDVEENAEELGLLQTLGSVLPAAAPLAGDSAVADSRRRRRAMTAVDWAGEPIGPSPLLPKIKELSSPLASQLGAEAGGVVQSAPEAAGRDIMPPLLFQVEMDASEQPSDTAAAGAADASAAADRARAATPARPAAIGEVSEENVSRSFGQVFQESAVLEVVGDVRAASAVVPESARAAEELQEALSNATKSLGAQVVNLVRQTANSTVVVNLTSIAAAPEPGKEKPVVVVQLSRIKVFGGLLLAAASVALLLAAAVSLGARGGASTSTEDKLQHEVQKLQVMRATDLQSMFSVASSSHPLIGQPLSPGILMRIQGRVASGPGGPLRSPFSARPCVVYSASVSRGRHDGVQPPPLSYDSRGADFELQLPDSSNLSMMVCGHDVSLFGMSAGLQANELAFAGAPESWRRFVLDNLVPTASATAHFDSCSDLSAAGGPLQFRECALLVGSEVTCIGEVVRDASGRLRLQPWQPPLPERIADQTLAGRVMASDCEELLDCAPARLRAAPALGFLPSQLVPAPATIDWLRGVPQALWKRFEIVPVWPRIPKGSPPKSGGFPIPDAPRAG